jgi:hypothetical protein
MEEPNDTKEHGPIPTLESTRLSPKFILQTLHYWSVAALYELGTEGVQGTVCRQITGIA